MKFYAQINENSICVGVSQLSGEVIADNMIEIDSADTDYLWRKYENGAWSNEKFEPQSTAPIDEFSLMQEKVVESEQAILELSTIIGGLM